GLDYGPNPFRVRGRNRDANLANDASRQTRIARQFSPGVPSVRRLEDAAARPAALQRPGFPIDFPETRIENTRVGRIHDQVDGSGLVAAGKNLVPGLAPVFRSKNSALIIRSPDVTQRRDVDEVRIFRMHANAWYLTRVVEAQVLPGLAAVGRFVHAVAVRNVAANRRFAHAHIDCVWIGIGQSDRPNRTRPKNRAVSDRLPIDAPVCCLPNTAADAAKIENHRL